MRRNQHPAPRTQYPAPGTRLLRVAVALALVVPPLVAQAPLTIGRLHYDGGGDWYANPSSLPNLLQAIGARTTLPVAAREKIVTLADADLWTLPTSI